MTDLVLESFRALVLAGIVVFLWRSGRRQLKAGHDGWGFIVAGFGLLLFGSLLDITDNFEALNRFVVVGDTEVEAFLEKLVGFLGGFVVLAWGLFRWLPRVGPLSPEIAQRQRAEAALRASEARLRAILDHAPMEIYLKDLGGRYVEINRRYEELWGITNAEVRGKLPGEVHDDPVFAEATRSHDLAVLRGGQVIEQEDEVTIDGAAHALHMIKFPIRSDDGEVAGLGALAIDVTERKQAAAVLERAHEDLERRVEERTEELRRSNDRLLRVEAKLREILENSPVGVAITTRSRDGIHVAGDRLFVNSALVRMFGGTDRESFIKASIDDSWVDLDQLAAVEKTFKDGGDLVDFEAQRRHMDGTTWWVSMNTRQIHFDGQDSTMVWHFDITKRKHAEAALRESEQRFRDYTEVSSDWVWEMDADLRFTYLSENVERSLGITPESHYGKTREEMLGDDYDREAWDDHLRTLREHKPFRNFEFLRVGEDIGSVWIRVSGVPLFAKDGVFLGYRGAASDITKRKRAEAAMRESEQRFRDYTEASVDWVWEMDANLRFTYLSKNIERILGAPPEWAYGKTRGELLGDDYDREAWDDHLRTLREHKPFRNFEYLRVGDGVVPRWLRTSGIPLFAEDGAFLGYRGAASDITKRKHAEAALRESEERLKDAIESISEGFILYDADDRFVLCNSRYRDFYPSIADMLKPGARFEDVARTAFEAGAIQGSAEDVEAWMERRLTQYSTAEGSQEQHLKDGRWVLCSETRTPTGGTVGIRTDITERRRAEAALRESRDQLRMVTDNLPILIIYMDVEHRYRFVNKTCAAWYARAPGDIIGKTAEEIHGSEYAKYQPHVEAVLAGEARTFEQAATYPDGVTRDTRVTYVPHIGPDSEVHGFFSFVEDITERRKAEETIRTRDLWLRTILENAPIQIVLKDTEGRIMAISRNVVQDAGLTREDFIGRTTADFTPDDVAELYMATDKEVVDTGRSIQQEVVEDWDGTTRYFLSSKFPLRDDDGQIVGVCSLTSDITETKQAEERLRQATLLARIGYYVWDVVADRCIFCSEEHAHIHGLTPDEYIARTTELDGEFSFAHPEDRGAVKAAMKALRKGEMFEMEYRVITAEGESRHVREIAQPVFDKSGRVVRQIGVCLDISEIKRAETLLARAMDVSPTVFALFDADDRLVISNQQYRDLYETEAAPIVPGVAFEDLVRAFAAKVGIGESKQDTEAWVANRLNRREHPAKSYEYQCSDGKWIEVSDHVLGDGSIFTVGLVITERRQAEEQLRQAQKMEAVGQLTGGIAHDFNNLLSIILGNAELLSDRIGADDPQIGALMRATNRGADLTQRLLAFSRRQPLQPKPIDVGALASGMVEMLQRSLGAAIEIEIASDRNLWTATADPGLLENALLNLAINARDAMSGAGTLVIETANAVLDEAYTAGRDDMAPGNYVRLSVTDTGAGMAPEVVERVFEPFFTTKDVGKGSGLGLSMVYGFAKQSGGHVAVYSEEGKGTTVTLYLPRTEAAVAATAAASIEDLPRGRGETILVVEDDTDIRELAIVQLEGLGYRVRVALDGKSALASLDDSPDIDLLLTDIVLPGGLDGRHLAREAERRLGRLKVLFMSGYAEPAIHLNGWVDKGADLLQKPFHRRDLAMKVRATLDRLPD